ncbi:MAG: hypothetical protein JRI95_05655 [Deltaproteobacteria bacterium]|nr:hypothetical protein [Deltaproteobacteria bacterium]MBW2085153.1 hypothetical protein [Deltaproteobacteria bacterium]
MTVTLSQIQKVMQVYGKQVRKGVRLKQGSAAEQSKPADQLRVSAEVKRKQVVERVASEIIIHLINGNFQAGGVENEIMTRLSREYGEPLNLSQDIASGQLIFHTVDHERGEIIQTLDNRESGKLAQRMIEITREMVDQTML